MDKFDENVMKATIETVKTSAGIKHDLKPQQIDALESFLRGNDTFVNLPTGFGKSLIYQLAPNCVDDINGSNKDASVEGHSIAIVISPLIALMRDQVKILKQSGINKAGYVADMKEDPQEMQQLLNGHVTLVFASPETLLGPLGRRLLCSPPYQKNLCGFFIDEGHCVAKWGFKSGKIDAFRHSYSRLAELRSLVPSHVPMVALTATASPDVKDLIVKTLGMTDVTCVQVSPERRNIKYSVVNTTEKDPLRQFGWLLEHLKQHQKETPKLIIYCQSHRQCRELHGEFEEVLGSDIAVHVAMFHSCSEEKRKQDILNDFTQADSNFRVLIATVAFGMGIHVENLHSVIHFGPSRTINDYFQETGRIGRDGLQSHAVLLMYPGCFSSCKVEQSMKDYLNSTECRRNTLLRYYGYSTQLDVAKHTCCDNCSSSCNCENENCHILEENEGWCFKNLKNINLHDTNQKEGGCSRIVSELQKQELRQKILDYRASLLEGLDGALYSGVDIASGISLSLIDNIVADCHTISIEQLDRYPFFNKSVASKIWSIIIDTLGTECEPSPLTIEAGIVDSDESSTSSSNSPSVSEEDYTRPVLWFSESSSTDTSSLDGEDI